MCLSRITIGNFKTFQCLDVSLENVVIAGENWVCMSNLLYGLRLIAE